LKGKSVMEEKGSLSDERNPRMEQGSLNGVREGSVDRKGRVAA
jgi:hypothetical protein